MTPPIDVERARADTPGVANGTHFNNCGASLMPAPVIEALKDYLDQEIQLGGYEAAEVAADRIEHSYDAVARLLNCQRDEVAFVENATRGFDMVFYAFDFQPGDRVLTASAEYVSNYLAYLQVAGRTGVRVEVVPDDAHGQLDTEALADMIDERVKLISVVHVPTQGGLVNPAERIGAIAHAHGIPFLLDACQSAGQLSLDVQRLHVDVLPATGRKYLRGPRGTGFVFVRRQLLETLEPPFLDLMSAEWTGPGCYEIRPDARRFETWERNVAGQIGLGVAVGYALGWGLDRIEDRVVSLAERMRQGLCTLPGVAVHDRGQRRCGIVTFTADQTSPEALVAGLKQRDIRVHLTQRTSALLDMDRRGLAAVVRAGVHYYNTEEEVDRLVETVAELVQVSL